MASKGFIKTLPVKVTQEEALLIKKVASNQNWTVSEFLRNGARALLDECLEDAEASTLVAQNITA